MLKSEHDVGDSGDNGSYSYYPYCCFNVSRLTQEMIFDQWVKLFVELYFLPFKLLGKQDELAAICKGFMATRYGVRGEN